MRGRRATFEDHGIAPAMRIGKATRSDDISVEFGVQYCSICLEKVDVASRCTARDDVPSLWVLLARTMASSKESFRFRVLSAKGRVVKQNAQDFIGKIQATARINMVVVLFHPSLEVSEWLRGISWWLEHTLGYLGISPCYSVSRSNGRVKRCLLGMFSRNGPSVRLCCAFTSHVGLCTFVFCSPALAQMAIPLARLMPSSCPAQPSLSTSPTETST
jgi:hypothetical protein